MLAPGGADYAVSACIGDALAVYRRSQPGPDVYLYIHLFAG
jgi:hypothetical protein